MFIQRLTTRVLGTKYFEDKRKPTECKKWKMSEGECLGFELLS
jgi:hypothetical protein